MNRLDRLARAASLALAAALGFVGAAAADAPPAPVVRAGSAARATRAACAELRIEPSPIRVAAGGALSLHAVGGAPPALFTIEGDAMGARVEPGGGLRAGDRAARFVVVARDACGAEARATAEVVGPLVVRPTAISLPRGGAVMIEATSALGPVELRLLDGPSGDGEPGGLDARGGFRAGTRAGVYHVLARDAGSGREARVTITVGAVEALAPRAPLVAVPGGGRARLDFRGGSGDIVVTQVTAGSVVNEGSALLFDARRAAPGVADVTVADRLTQETSSVRVLIGEALGAPTLVRGPQTQLGDLASGDLNGDGLGDLVVGHAERSRGEAEAGGILVAYGQPSGSLAPPVVVVEGHRALDHQGAALLVTDMNGDGIDDVVAGAPDENLGENDRGSVAIYLGSKGGLQPTPDRVLVGEDVSNLFGTALAAADLDGDGAPELVTSAPNARSPSAPACGGGRVYVFRNLGRARGVVAALPSQVIDIREPLGDDATAKTACSASPLGGGRALALVDMDGDKIVDLVVGAPLTSFPAPGRAHGAVLVYRGARSGSFEDHPSWAVHLTPELRSDGASFGAALDVVRASPEGPAALVVRAPGLSPRPAKGAPLTAAGGFFVFTPGALGLAAPRDASGASLVRVVTTAAARAFFVGAAPHRGAGRSAALGDVDPRPGAEYLVGEVTGASEGRVAIFSAVAVIEGRGALVPFAELPTSTAGEQGGARVAVVRGAAPASGGLAIWAPWRSTAVGPFVGAIDWVQPGAAPLAARIGARVAIPLANYGAGDRAGTAVAFAQRDKSRTPDALVGAPGAQSPAAPGKPAGSRLRSGLVDVFRGDASAPLARIWEDRDQAQMGGSFVVLDFDGDGTPEVAVADQTAATGGPAAEGAIDPSGCNALDAKGQNPKDVPVRGAVHIYGLVASAFVERFRVVSPRELAREGGGPRFVLNHTGTALAAADVNGDGKEDLIIGRPGGRDSTGAEIVLGRKPDPSGKVLIACNTGEDGPLGATALAPLTERAPVHYGAAVAKLGDLDRDGCDEAAFSIKSSGYPGPARAGVLVAFGYDASGARCQGHRRPFSIHVVPDDLPLANNVEGDVARRADDTLDLKGAPTSMGAALPRGSGDLTGDGIPDLVFRDVDPGREGQQGAAVEIISGAYLTRLCPGHVCRKGRSGPLWSDADFHVLALRTIAAPERLVLAADGADRGFGGALALGDLDGDGIADLAASSDDDGTKGGAFAGSVRVFRGGASLLGKRDAASPWLLAVPGTSERGAFGTSIALARDGGAGLLLLGAPQSSRGGAGFALGAAYRFRVEVPR